MSYQPYLENKNSGVEWLGEVPKHWGVRRLKYSVRLLTEKTDRRDHSVALENIEGWTGRFIPSETEFMGEGVAFVADDILFGKLRPYLGKAYRAERSGEAVGDFHVLRPMAGTNSRFTQYQILNREFISIVDGSTFGSKMPRASWDFFGGMKVTVPPLQEQTEIAAFLDGETAKIDELAKAFNGLIGLLKEKRQAVISHAVSKGLDSSVPMKDSGIEWLGQVPAHWEVKKVRNFAEILRGKFTQRPRNDPAFYDGDFPFIQTGDVTATKKYITEFTQTLNERGIAVSKQFPKGTLVMTIAANIGDVAVLDFPAYFPDSIVGLIPNEKSELMFLFYLMKAMRQPLEMNATVSTQMNLNIEQIGSLSAACPPVVEQKKIFEYLDLETEKIDQLTSQAEMAIELLKERRSALISAAVTGKIPIRPSVHRERWGGQGRVLLRRNREKFQEKAGPCCTKRQENPAT